MKQLKGGIASLLSLIVLVLCTIMARIQGDVVAYVVLMVISILVLNVVFILAGRIGYRGLIGIYSGYTLFISVLGALGLLGVADYLVDLAYVILLLLVLTVYHHYSSLREVLVAYIPVIILASVIAGISLGLQNPLRYAILALVDAFSAIIVLSSVKNHIMGFITCLLLFILLYSTPILTLDIIVFSVLLALYILRVLLVLYNKIHSLRLIVSLELLVRPLLVIYL